MLSFFAADNIYIYFTFPDAKSKQQKWIPVLQKANFTYFLQDNKKERGSNPLSSDNHWLQCQFAAAIIANALILVQRDLLVAAAENAAGFVLAQNNGIALGINLQGITASHVQRFAQFDG